MERQKKKDTDMTEGVIWKQLLWFALPLGQERKNSVVLEYDLARETYMLHDFGGAVDFARAGQMREKLLVLGADGVVRAPLALGMMTGSPFSMYAMQEFVVPRSMPIIYPIENSSAFLFCG